MKYSQWIGCIAALTLIISSFLPWTWHPDLQKMFTGFFSQDNIYGKPGKGLVFLSCIAIVFYLVPRIWAKRFNLFFCALTVAYAFSSFLKFSSCYRGICPVKQLGIYLMLSAAFIMLIMALLPNNSISGSNDK